MMTRSVSVLAVASLLLSGCLCQTSVHPFVPKAEAIDVPGIDGFWVETGGDNSPSTLEIRRADSGRMRKLMIGELGKTTTEAFSLAVGQIGDTLVWDMLPESGDGMADLQRLPLHTLARLKLEGDRLEVAFLDAEWVSSRCLRGDLDLEHLRLVDDEGEAKDDDFVILTGPTPDLRGFIEDVLDNDEAFGEADVFVRRRPGVPQAHE
jgi:hypothetical protein